MKMISMLLAGVIFSLAGYGQSSHAEKEVQEAGRRADAGKADVIIARNRNIFDSTTFSTDTPKAANNKTLKARSKTKPRCQASATNRKPDKRRKLSEAK